MSTQTQAETETPITFAKLRSGEWGVRGPEDKIFEGANVLVLRRDGFMRGAVVDRVIWTGNGVALASIVPPEYLGKCWACGQQGRVGRRCRLCHDGHFRY